VNSTAVFGSGFMMAGAIAVSAFVLWWLVRRRRHEVLMPIVRILLMPQTKLPRIVVKKPPMFAFLAFLICTTAFVVWTSEPKQIEFTSGDPSQLKAHVFVDMSPSVSSLSTEAQLSAHIMTILQKLNNKSRVTISTSHSPSIYELVDDSKIESIIQGLGFHRSGVSIGHAIKKALQSTGEVDLLIIVSDRDAHSWGGFQWKFLEGETKVFWAPVPGAEDFAKKSNVFIQAIKSVRANTSDEVEWDVDVAMGGLPKSQEGVVRVRRLDQTLATSTWKIGPGSRGAKIRLSWSRAENNQTESVDDGESLLWEIVPTTEDAISLDNEFRTSWSGMGGAVKIISEPSGEMPIEDPGYSLQTVFNVLGIEVNRVDSNLKKDSKSPIGSGKDEGGVWVLMGGSGHGEDSFCPVVEANKIWIMPNFIDSDYNELCRCFDLQKFAAKLNCTGVNTKEQWIESLVNAKGIQIGGETGAARTALAFGFTQPGDTVAKREILAFTVPLVPAKTTGISYGNFPKIVRQLLKWQILAADAGESSIFMDWPRISDLSSFDETLGSKVFSSPSARLSNVPVNESILEVLPLSELPPKWSISGPGPNKTGYERADSEDPIPWIQGVLILILLVMLIEAFYNFFQPSVFKRRLE